MKADDDALRRWTPLVNHIIARRFAWMVDGGGHGGPRRVVDHEDMMQEGLIALRAALERYDPDRFPHTSPKTYLYRAVYNRISRMVGDNATHMKLPNLGTCLKTGTQEKRDKAKLAINYRLFSEIGYGHGSGRKVYDKPDERLDHVEDIDGSDFLDVFMTEMTAVLSERQLKILLMHMSGDSYRQIGNKIKLSHEHVRRELNVSIAKCQTLRRMIWPSI